MGTECLHSKPYLSNSCPFGYCSICQLSYNIGLYQTHDVTNGKEHPTYKHSYLAALLYSWRSEQYHTKRYRKDSFTRCRGSKITGTKLVFIHKNILYISGGQNFLDFSHGSDDPIKNLYRNIDIKYNTISCFHNKNGYYFIINGST